MTGTNTAKAQTVILDVPRPGEQPKAVGDNGVLTVKNSYSFPIVVTAWDVILSLTSSAHIQPGATVTLPTYISAGVSLYCWHGSASGCNWELGFFTVTMHYHELKTGVTPGSSVEFGAAAAQAG
jgi:hypothetical protein